MGVYTHKLSCYSGQIDACRIPHSADTPPGRLDRPITLALGTPQRGQTMAPDEERLAIDFPQLPRLPRTTKIPYRRLRISPCISTGKRLEGKRLPRQRVTERQPVRMQRLPRKLNRAQRLGPISIPRLANKRVTVQPSLQSDLIPAAG